MLPRSPPTCTLPAALRTRGLMSPPQRSVLGLCVSFPPGNWLYWSAPGTGGRKGSLAALPGSVLAVALWILEEPCTPRGRGAGLATAAVCGAQSLGLPLGAGFLWMFRLGFKSHICSVPHLPQWSCLPQPSSVVNVLPLVLLMGEGWRSLWL